MAKQELKSGVDDWQSWLIEAHLQDLRLHFSTCHVCECYFFDPRWGGYMEFIKHSNSLEEKVLKT